MADVRFLIALALAAPAIVSVVEAATAPTQFRRDPALLRATQDRLVQTVRSKDPRGAAALEKAFSQDVVAAVEPAFRAYGYRTDDTVDSTAVYWITAWEASHGLVGTTTDPAAARGVRAQLAGALAPRLAGQSDAFKQNIADLMLLQALLADARMNAAKAAGPAALKAMSDTVYGEASKLLKVDLRAVDMTSKGFTPVVARPAGPASTPPPTAAVGREPVAGTYFRAIAGTGAAVSFEPLVLFANGDYVELGATPLADLDPAADKRRSPARWGHWRKQGSKFLLSGSDGRTNDYQLGSGNFFPAFAAAAGPRLSGTYSNTTGSSTYLPGGIATTLAVDKISFNPDGTFAQGKSAGGVAPNAAIGNRSRASGRWRLAGSALELDYADGRRVRTSFLWGASGSPPKPDADMAFIGGDVFTRD